ncbi:MAG: hypothetical protein ABF811_03490 [Pseudoclavibacter sp.]
MNLSHVLRRTLVYSAILSGAIAVVGGIVGGLVAGGRGILSAVIGAALGLVFFGITTLSVLLGRRLGSVGMIGVVVGGWMLKAVVFIVILASLRGAAFVNGPVLFFCLVAVSLGTVLIDAMVFMRARLPLIDEPLEPSDEPREPSGEPPSEAK